MKVYFIILLSIISSFSIAQNPIDNIDFKNPNSELLESLIETKVNAYRKSKKINQLKYEDKLTMAAKDQAGFMAKIKRVTHDQPSKNKKSAFERVKYYNGNFAMVGENCHNIFCGVKTKIYGEREKIVIETYEEAAEALVKGWINSTDHHQNIIDEDFYTVGTGVAFNKENNSIYATQVFASEKYIPPTKSEKKKYGIKEYNQKACSELEKDYPYLPELLSNNIYFENGKIYFYFHDLEFLKDIIKKSKDAIGVDIILREQYGCETGNKLHSAETHDGYLLKPLKKSALYSKNEAKQTNEMFVSFGEIPSFVDTIADEFNLLIIKDGCACQSIFYNNIGEPALSKISLEWELDTFSITDKTDSIKRIVEFTIPFDKAKYNYKLEDIKPLLDSLEVNKYDIKKIELTAYSSIEGKEELNVELQKKRAASILKAIEEYQLEKIISSVKTEENWEGFYESIKGSPYEAELKQFSKDQLRKIVLSDTLGYNLEPYLKDQRKGKVLLYLEKVYVDSLLLETIDERINYALTNNDYKKAKALQTALIKKILNKEADYSKLLELDIPRKPETIDLLNNQIALLNIIADTSKLDSIYKINNKEFDILLQVNNKNGSVLYNKYYTMLELWNIDLNTINSPEEFEKDIKKLSSYGINKEKINQMLLNFHLIATEYYYEKRKFDERDRSLKEIKKTLLKSNLNTEQSFELASYFMFQMKIDWAVEILHPLIKEEKYTEDLLFSFLTIAIYAEDQVSQEEFLMLMAKAKSLNLDRFCKLIGFPNMSFQLLKNKNLKKEYCQSCSQ